MTPEAFTEAANPTLRETKKRFSRKKVRWNVAGESTARTGYVLDVTKRNDTVILQVNCFDDGDPEISFISFVDAKKVSLLNEYGAPKLRVIDTQTSVPC
ncbi:MAG: hypothetical protein CMH31_00355 [Micavibrio sp.]|nr:hypothetical protein [Micavibrio sp.]|tara:strand:- start:130 stop:426 length:297 start_codon:yes stop_codon:yes gene_type:complete